MRLWILMGHQRSSPESRHTIGHAKVRKAHLAETAEDYVEAIAELIEKVGEARVGDLAKRFGVSHVTVSRTVGRLVRADPPLAQTAPYRPITLTAAGKRLAREAKHRHDLVRAFLIAIGVDERTADVDAEGIEHHVSPKTLKAFESFLEQGR